jgi:hypothetical protein
VRPLALIVPYVADHHDRLRLRIGEPLGMLRAAQEDDVLPLETPIRLTNGKTVDHLPIRKGDIITLPSVCPCYLSRQPVLIVCPWPAEPRPDCVGRGRARVPAGTLGDA